MPRDPAHKPVVFLHPTELKPCDKLRASTEGAASACPCLTSPSGAALVSRKFCAMCASRVGKDVPPRITHWAGDSCLCVWNGYAMVLWDRGDFQRPLMVSFRCLW